MNTPALGFFVGREDCGSLKGGAGGAVCGRWSFRCCFARYKVSVCINTDSVYITFISNKANIRKRQISKNGLGWWRGILGSFDLWFAAVIGFVHDLTVGPCTYCILKEQYKKSWTHLHHLVKNQWCWHLV